MSAETAFLKTYQQNKITFWIALVVLCLFVYIYFKGKADGKTNIADAKYIYGSAGIPKGFNPNILADTLHEVMSDLFTLTGTKDKAWNQLVNLQTDDMVIAVYNAFNDKYGAEGEGTLTQWINDEKYYDFSTGVKTKALNKLRSLRLT
ncbi:hypothetical protein [Pedobacter cryophilus]|uniref:Uncharacterized protein n=1 Tax=Pedobacter cryophilus TaxID=2571271 RepID=A0A4V5NX05_9SPHI|nr:hypothetical protein [Pedobacter cryophilus]TKB96850.1 hypothetical protein FA046_12290 [Pedobacter cryophilus]